MNFRTDLAIEAREFLTEKEIPGITSQDSQIGNVQVSTIQIHSQEAAHRLHKPIGTYITITVEAFSASITAADDAVEAVCSSLRRLLQRRGLTLVVGLGNHNITPDALGPLVTEGILATRHIQGAAASAAGLDTLAPVAAISPGVLGQTGMETSEIIGALVDFVKPDQVIVIDALAAQNPQRLGRTVQISDTGISPGSGVLNRRKELSSSTLGVPVISMGVPTVVDSTTLVHSVLEQAGASLPPPTSQSAMMVTPRDIDTLISRSAKVISLGINSALQPDISREDLIYLTM